MKTDEQQKVEAIEDISRASRAEQFMKNPLYIEALAVMEAAIYTEFQNSKLGDVELRHELWQRTKQLEQFKSRFESIIKHGKKARDTLTMLERAKKSIGM